MNQPRNTAAVTLDANQVPLKVQDTGKSNAPRKLPPVTPETIAKAHAAKAAKTAWAKANLRRDFLDSGTWDDLAKQAGLRLPSWSAVPTPGQMSVWLKKLGISATRYLEWSGEKSLKDFRKANPSWPLRAWVGIVMELKANG